MPPASAGDPTADMEMSSKEAAAYLSGPAGYTLTAKFVRGLRYLDIGPMVEKRGGRLVYRKSALDAFLSENGKDPEVWIQGGWKKVADQLRGIAEVTGDAGFDQMIETLDKRGPQDGWDIEE